jgi:hypothetical protein
MNSFLTDSVPLTEVTAALKNFGMISCIKVDEKSNVLETNNLS